MEYTPRRKLTREFKLEAVRQTALSEKPKAQVARELCVRGGQLQTWHLEFEKEAATGIAKPDRSAAEDLEQLRRENAKLKVEIEILKKAAIYFARKSVDYHAKLSNRYHRKRSRDLKPNVATIKRLNNAKAVSVMPIPS